MEISMDGYRDFGHIHGYCGYPRLSYISKVIVKNSFQCCRLSSMKIDPGELEKAIDEDRERKAFETDVESDSDET